MISNAIIYIIEHNTLPQYKYVGQTSNTLKQRWYVHKSTSKMYHKMCFRLGFFINYFDGIENFTIKEYKTYNNISQLDLYNEENKYIKEFGTINSRNENVLITIKITNEMRNDLIKKFIDKKTDIINLYKLINTFKYDYKREKLNFTLNDTNKTLLTDLLKTELYNKLLNTQILAFADVYYTLTDEFIKDENIIEDYLSYIDIFNNNFEITNDVNDMYFYDDLLYGLTQYGEIYDLFDFYLLLDFDKILQYYFNILNQTYSNVKIDRDYTCITGIKKINNISFKFSEKIYYLISYYIENINYKKDKSFNPEYIEDNIKKSCVRDRRIINNFLNDCSNDKCIKNNRMYISKLRILLYPLLKKLTTFDDELYDTDDFKFHYSRDLLQIETIIKNNDKLLMLINTIFNYYYDTEFVIVNNEYIISK